MAQKTATASKKTTTASKKTTTPHTKVSQPVTAKKVTAKKTKKTSTRKYGPATQTAVAKELRKYKKGTARSGKAGLPVKSRKQAIAIGLSEAREAGAKVPKKKSTK